MKQNEKHYEAWNFLTANFGDGLNGKSEMDILKETIAISKPEYIVQMKRELQKLVNDNTVDHRVFLRECNLYTETEEDSLKWLKGIVNNLNL